MPSGQNVSLLHIISDLLRFFFPYYEGPLAHSTGKREVIGRQKGANTAKT